MEDVANEGDRKTLYSISLYVTFAGQYVSVISAVSPLCGEEEVRRQDWLIVPSSNWKTDFSGENAILWTFFGDFFDILEKKS